MRTNRVRWAAAAIACLGGGVLVAAPTGALAASHSHHAPAPKHHPKKHHPKPKPDHSKGFFIGTRTSTEKVTNLRTPSALVRDGDGGLHLVTTKPNSSGDKGHILYLTRDAGSKKWRSRAVPGLRPLAGTIQVESHLSTDGRRVFAVFYQCDGVYVADAAIGAARLPEPTQVIAEDNCATASPTSDNPPVANAIPLAGHRIGVLLPDPAQGGTDAIFSGSPAGTFTAGAALPTTDGFTPKQMTVDPETGNILVVGEGSDGTNKGIYVVSQSAFTDTWAGPKLVASLGSPTTDYTVETVQAFRNHKYIGLLRPAGAGAHPKHSLFIVVGTPSGQWTGAVALPHTNGQDTALRLIVNPATTHLHAVWTRIDPSSKVKKSGIMHEASNANGWFKPYFVTHWYRDVATQITLNASGAFRPIIGYNQN